MAVSRVKRATIGLGAMFGALALASCAVSTASAPVIGQPAPVPAGLERFYGQQLGWESCASFAATETERSAYTAPRVECARLEVPLDYTAPTGRTAQIAVLRHRTKSSKRISSLVVNPGGPGGSGMALAANLSEHLGDGPFDIVGFDPRGVGSSTPAIDCYTDAEHDALRAKSDYDNSPAGVRRDEDESRYYAELCAQRSGGVEVLANAGTRDVARDVDVLRAALGDNKLTYLGFSYGTRIGTTYAEQFPSNVRAMVLDGAVDPTETALDRTVAQLTGFQQAFQTFATDCARRADCPLGTDPAGATAQFQALVRPLIERPAPVPGDTRTLSYDDAITAVIASMYSNRDWPKLADGLTRLRAGDGSGLMRLADGYQNRAENGTYDNSDESRLVINCLDGSRVTDRALAEEIDRRGNESAPFADAGRGASGALGVCAFLPVSPSSEPHLPDVAGLPPTLVISTTGDPATPYQAGVALAGALHGGLLTVEGAQHTAAADGHPCVDAIVRDYLVKLRLPAEGARCTLRSP